MKYHNTSNLPRFGQRLFTLARALPSLLALAALAIPAARADVVFTRDTSRGEQFAQYTATYTAPVTGSYALGFNLTAPLTGDNSILIDAVTVTHNGTTLFANGFETGLAPNTGVSSNGGTAKSGGWVFSNYAGILNGSPPNWGLAGPAFTLAPADGTHQYAYLQAVFGTLGRMRAATNLALVAGETYTVSFYQASRYDFGGNTTYTVTLDAVPPPAVNWVDWRETMVENNVTKYVGTMVVPRADGGATSVTVKYTPPNQINGGNGFPGIWQFQHSNGNADYHDYFANGVFGTTRNPARSPYTSAKVPNIPDGGGQASNKADIIELRYRGTNSLEFFDASTGQPIEIASPVFAYVSLNGNGYGFNQDFDILSFGDGVVRDAGFWGSGTSNKQVVDVNGTPQYQLLGTGEPHGTLQFRGSFSTVTWQSLSDEAWNGFTVGVAQLAADVPIANAGLDQTVTANSAAGATLQLAGSVSGSTHAPFTFTWAGPFGTANGENPTVTLPVGTSTVTLVVSDADGASDTDTVVITVLPNPAPVITSPTLAEGTYGSLFFYVIEATNSPETFDAGNLPPGLTLNGAVISGRPTETGSFGVGLSATNSGGTGSTMLLLVVKKAVPTVVATPYSVTFDGNSHAATFAITGVNGDTGTAVGNVLHNTTHTAAGNYSDEWSFKGNAHYEDLDPAPIANSIAKASAQINVAGYSGTYDGNAHGATGTATGVGGVDLSAGLSLGASYTNAPGGTANWSFAGSNNYQDASGSVAITINKATATVIVTPYRVEFDGQSHQASVASIAGVNGETGATVGAVSLQTTHTAVGSYNDSWTFTGGTNYLDTSGSLTDVIEDTTAPVISSVTPSSATLWPPNHQMVAISVNAVASDLAGLASLKIIHVTSSEPDNGLGDGDTPNDSQITGNLTVNLRAERSGNGNGRTYTITVEAKDAAGNATTRTCTVSVPKSQGKAK
jgi:hypothetical protein